MRLRWALAIALAAPTAAGAASAGDPVVASRLEDAVVLDGRLDDPAWSRAQPYDGFVQLFPDDGAPPSERTVVRVLYDDRALYVGVFCEHRDPDRIVRALGRRDAAPFSDYVLVFVDSMRDRRTGYAFGISAAGVQEDFLYYDDESSTSEWDAVWGAATAAAPGGWTAELEIPLSVLRFSAAREQVWGFAVRRMVAHSHEETASVLVRRGERGMVSRLGTLVGLRDLRPPRDVEVTPYAALRLSRHPEDEDVPRPRVTDPIFDVGFDLKASIGSAFALQATVNPDFGQVEADQIVQNLTTYELMLPEKRPLFLQGMDLFQPVAPAGNPSPQQLFYSRRIGLDTPILGAAKLTGQMGDVQVGLVEAFVTGADRAPPGESSYSAAQPLHLAPRRAYPEAEPAARNFLAAVARWQEAPKRTFGAAFTSALGERCTEGELLRAEALGEDPPPRCEALTGNAAALDWSLRDATSEWYLRGQLTGSQYLGGRPTLVLGDGTRVDRGDLGLGAFASAGREGGEPWRFDVSWEYESPELQLNATGFQRTQNEQAARATLTYARPTGNRVFHDWDAGAGAELRLTTDGRGLVRGQKTRAWAQGQLRSFHKVGCDATLDAAAWDVREIAQSGIAYERPAAWSASCWLASDQALPVWLQATLGYGRTVAAGPLASLAGWSGDLTLVWRPHARVESLAEVHYASERHPARWIEREGPVSCPGGQPPDSCEYFGDLRAPALSLTVREQVVLSPRLSVQAYAQFFTSYYDYGRVWWAPAGPGTARIRPADLSPALLAPGEDPDGRETALNVNVVLRWEYRLGSTLYLVYARTQAEPEVDSPELTLAPRSLSRGPVTDTFLLKWTYWWNR